MANYINIDPELLENKIFEIFQSFEVPIHLQPEFNKALVILVKQREQEAVKRFAAKLINTVGNTFYQQHNTTLSMVIDRLLDEETK